MTLAQIAQGWASAGPDERSLSGFASGKLAIPAAEAIAEHLGNCRRCKTILGGLDLLADSVVQVVRTSANVMAIVDADCHRVTRLIAALIA